MLERLEQFHQTRPGHVAFGLLELLMAWGFADWALDDGFWLWWIVAVFLTVGGLQNLIQSVWRRK